MGCDELLGKVQLNTTLLGRASNDTTVIQDTTLSADLLVPPPAKEELSTTLGQFGLPRRQLRQHQCIPDIQRCPPWLMDSQTVIQGGLLPESLGGSILCPLCCPGIAGPAGHLGVEQQGVQVVLAGLACSGQSAQGVGQVSMRWSIPRVMFQPPTQMKRHRKPVALPLCLVSLASMVLGVGSHPERDVPLGGHQQDVRPISNDAKSSIGTDGARISHLGERFRDSLASAAIPDDLLA